MTELAALIEEAASARAYSLGSAHRTSLPLDQAKREDVRFRSEFRAENVEQDGRQFVQLEGYASVVETPYQMWDVFGPYDEIVSRSAFDKTLSAKPMVVYRFNHGGMPMASTQNGRLELWADDTGLGNRALVNAERADVQDLVHAIRDGDVTEQSFMFQIDDGIWNDDFTEFRINQVNMDRGDTGPVTYGASPHTLVAARSGEILSSLLELPPLAAREALATLNRRHDIDLLVDAPKYRTSLDLALAQWEVDEQVYRK